MCRLLKDSLLELGETGVQPHQITSNLQLRYKNLVPFIANEAHLEEEKGVEVEAAREVGALVEEGLYSKVTCREQ